MWHNIDGLLSTAGPTRISRDSLVGESSHLVATANHRHPAGPVYRFTGRLKHQRHWRYRRLHHVGTLRPSPDTGKNPNLHGAIIPRRGAAGHGPRVKRLGPTKPCAGTRRPSSVAMLLAVAGRPHLLVVTAVTAPRPMAPPCRCLCRKTLMESLRLGLRLGNLWLGGGLRCGSLQSRNPWLWGLQSRDFRLWGLQSRGLRLGGLPSRDL